MESKIKIDLNNVEISFIKNSLIENYVKLENAYKTLKTNFNKKHNQKVREEINLILKKLEGVKNG